MTENKPSSFGYGHKPTQKEISGSFITAKTTEKKDISFDKIVLETGEEKIIKYQAGYLITVILISGEAKIYSGHWMKTLHEFSDRSVTGSDLSDVKISNSLRKKIEVYVVISKLNN